MARPTGLTLAILRRSGLIASVAEKWVPMTMHILSLIQAADYHAGIVD
jgi:hypothetical protein